MQLSTFLFVAVLAGARISQAIPTEYDTFAIQAREAEAAPGGSDHNAISAAGYAGSAVKKASQHHDAAKHHATHDLTPAQKAEANAKAEREGKPKPYRKREAGGSDHNAISAAGYAGSAVKKASQHHDAAKHHATHDLTPAQKAEANAKAEREGKPKPYRKREAYAEADFSDYEYENVYAREAYPEADGWYDEEF